MRVSKLKELYGQMADAIIESFSQYQDIDDWEYAYEYELHTIEHAVYGGLYDEEY